MLKLTDKEKLEHPLRDKLRNFSDDRFVKNFDVILRGFSHLLKENKPPKKQVEK